MSSGNGAAEDPLQHWSGRRVLVVGEVILDRYEHGHVERISPEAPVPVVRLERRETRLGGAANVIANLVSLGATPRLMTVVGDDAAGEEVRGLLRALGVELDGVLTSADRPTPVKTRVLARHQQVVRLDEERDHPLGDVQARALLDGAADQLASVEGLIVSDYAKGLLDRRSLPPLLACARQRGLPTVIDPKVRHFELYTPATLITPNQMEAGRAAAIEIRTQDDVLAAARLILRRLELEAVLVTRGEEGMLLVPRQGAACAIAAQAREVFDVTGAGDTVAATVGLALAAGEPVERAARWANAAAAVAVGHLGTAAVTRDELRAMAGGAR
ncbi:MAG: D-glycero-beta-D-manno-heptose-7-phosphate kinase [Acidobacteriota bacterium]|nr:MAG: D-glycero-beta-D-manno-heptose-7-phosphate kinase [Acidobacteriota bacterium]